MANTGEHSEGSETPSSDLVMPVDLWQDLERAEKAARADAYGVVGDQLARLIALEPVEGPTRMYHRTYHEGNSRRVVIARFINGVMPANRIIVNDMSVDIYNASCVTIKDSYVGLNGFNSFAQKITAVRQLDLSEPWDDSITYGPLIQGDAADVRWPVHRKYTIPLLKSVAPLGKYLLQIPAEGQPIETLDIPQKLMEVHDMLKTLDEGTRVGHDG